MLESLSTQRLAFMVETYSLLDYNQFGDLKQKITVDAFLVLQKKIFQVWKDRKVFSLIMFDVKGAFNVLAIEVLLDCLRKKQTSEQMTPRSKVFIKTEKPLLQSIKKHLQF